MMLFEPPAILTLVFIPQMTLPEAPSPRDSWPLANRSMGLIVTSPAEETSPAYSYEANYLREMKHFLDAVRGEADFSGSSPAEELHNLQVFHTAVASAQTGQELTVG